MSALARLSEPAEVHGPHTRPGLAPGSGVRSHYGSPPSLRVENMSKRFGALAALTDVSFTLRPGSVHALLGENGAGKSTLVKCIMGFHRPDQGRVVVGNARVTVSSPRHAQQLGLGMVYQHFTLVENMTVAENLVLARMRLPKVIDWRREHVAISTFMDSMPFRVPVTRYVRQLAAGEKQKLEILKQLYLGSRIIILDEPTSVLTPQEADAILGTLRQMVEGGDLSVAMITHKLREVIAFADEVTVLRRGQVSGSGSAKALTARELATMMVGAEPPDLAMQRTPCRATIPRLVLNAVCADDDVGLRVLDGLRLEVRPGEIVGIAGVSGNGQDELVEVLAGQRPLTGGEVLVNGKRYTPTRSQIRRERVRLLPEAPLANACVAQMSVAENIALRCFDARPIARGGWLVSKSRLRARAERAVAEYGIKTTSVDAPMASLSGGNVQRAVLARELADDAAVLVAANPCFGLDFAAVTDIRRRITLAREAGAAVLLVSADLDEIFALSDRIAVMSEGRIVYECLAGEADLAEIGQRMAGATNTNSSMS